MLDALEVAGKGGMMIKLGDEVRDKLTEFQGIVVAKAQYLYGCQWINVVPKFLHEGQTIENAWFDEDRFEVVTDTDHIKPSVPYKGGPSLKGLSRSIPKPSLG